MNKEIESAPHCVQCGKEMPFGADLDKILRLCTNPECPNYALFQAGMEDMIKLSAKLDE